jgi:hypothetical protein
VGNETARPRLNRLSLLPHLRSHSRILRVQQDDGGQEYQGNQWGAYIDGQLSGVPHTYEMEGLKMITTIKILWIPSGVVLGVVLLGMREQDEGASIALIPAAFLGPFMALFVFYRWLQKTGGHF